MLKNFETLGLNKQILGAIESLGYKEPTTVQSQAIPLILEKSDIIASSETGSGKTAAFLLPTLQHLVNSEKKSRNPKALILVPTRELGIQISNEAKKFCKNLPQIRTACIYGGVSYIKQKRDLSRGVDIIVATPGRLYDLVEQKRIDLSQVEIFILDEVDRMLTMGFIEIVQSIVALLPKKRQTLLFSATIDKTMFNLSKSLQTDPKQIKIASEKTVLNIAQELYLVDCIQHKRKLLDHFLNNTVIHQAIIFTATKRLADELAFQLKSEGHSSDSLQGDMTQRQRTRTIERLKKGDLKILVATDVASRGIDVSTLSHVINFDLPQCPEDFIHRIGRTGRAGAKGIAITFASHRENHLWQKIQELLKNPISPSVIEGLEPKPQKKSNPARKRFPSSNKFGAKKSFSNRSSFPGKRNSQRNDRYKKAF